eukprot:Pgem_evm1s14042
MHVIISKLGQSNSKQLGLIGFCISILLFFSINISYIISISRSYYFSRKVLFSPLNYNLDNLAQTQQQQQHNSIKQQLNQTLLDPLGFYENINNQKLSVDKKSKTITVDNCLSSNPPIDFFGETKPNEQKYPWTSLPSLADFNGGEEEMLTIAKSMEQKNMHSIDDIKKVVIGMVSVKREHDYLQNTLVSLIKNYFPTELYEKGDAEEINSYITINPSPTIVVLFADQKSLDPKYFIPICHLLWKFVQTGVLQFYTVPQEYYKPAKARTYGDSWNRIKWRSKQNLDFGYMFRLSEWVSRAVTSKLDLPSVKRRRQQLFIQEHLSLMKYTNNNQDNRLEPSANNREFFINSFTASDYFYVHIEDDISASQNWFPYMHSVLLKKMDDFIHTASNKPRLLSLSFSTLGFIGKSFLGQSASHLLSKFLIDFYDLRPCDWLINDFAGLTVHKVENWPVSLFQHEGVVSSLKGKKQPLRDDRINGDAGKYNRIKQLADAIIQAIVCNTSSIKFARKDEQFTLGEKEKTKGVASTRIQCHVHVERAIRRAKPLKYYLM